MKFAALLLLAVVAITACVVALPQEQPVLDEHEAHSDGEAKPPVDKDGRPLGGWLGTIVINTPEGWWVDTDGVDPETPGCHYAYKLYEECVEREPSDEVIAWLGEECRGNILVETNPAAGECHQHAKGIGKPDTFDCDQYCMLSPGGYHWGKCVPVEDVCDGPKGTKIASAKCECGYGTPPETRADAARLE